jgi:hypothetical protein
MVVLSKIKEVLEFFFKKSPELEKHQKYLHPILTYIISIGGAVKLS